MENIYIFRHLTTDGADLYHVLSQNIIFQSPSASHSIPVSLFFFFFFFRGQVWIQISDLRRPPGPCSSGVCQHNTLMDENLLGGTDFTGCISCQMSRSLNDHDQTGSDAVSCPRHDESSNCSVTAPVVGTSRRPLSPAKPPACPLSPHPSSLSGVLNLSIFLLIRPPSLLHSCPTVSALLFCLRAVYRSSTLRLWVVAQRVGRGSGRIRFESPVEQSPRRTLDL